MWGSTIPLVFKYKNNKNTNKNDISKSDFLLFRVFEKMSSSDTYEASSGGGGGGSDEPEIGMFEKFKETVSPAWDWAMENGKTLVAIAFVALFCFAMYKLLKWADDSDDFTNAKMQGLSGTEVDPEVRKLVEKINKGLDDYRKAGGV